MQHDCSSNNKSVKEDSEIFSQIKYKDQRKKSMNKQKLSKNKRQTSKKFFILTFDLNTALELISDHYWLQ